MKVELEVLRDALNALLDHAKQILHEDLRQVSAIGRGEEPLGHALVWAASLLRAIGDRTP